MDDPSHLSQAELASILNQATWGFLDPTPTAEQPTPRMLEHLAVCALCQARLEELREASLDLEPRSLPTQGDIPDEDTLEKSLTVDIEIALSRLPAIGSKIVSLCFGLDGSEPMRVEQIAEVVGVDSDDVRRILRESMATLRR